MVYWTLQIGHCYLLPITHQHSITEVQHYRVTLSVSNIIEGKVYIKANKLFH